MRVAAVQLKGNRGLDGNLEVAEQWLRFSSGKGVELAVLPENFAYLHQRPLAEVAASEKTSEGIARSFISDLARELGMWILAGTIPVADGQGGDEGKPFAASLLYGPTGKEWARYDKIHLFDVQVAATGRTYRESDDYRAGGSVVTADVAGKQDHVKLGLSVCYDLRFPELYRQQSRAGATVLAAPSAFTANTGEAHWALLLRARAVENLCFMIGANMADRTHPKNPTWGGSAVIDPWGRVLAALDDEEGCAIASLDLKQQESLRENMPVLSHRRLSGV